MRAVARRLARVALTGAFASLLAVTHASEPPPPETLALCTSCHGESGVPADPAVPILSGQEFYYLYVQLKDYKAGRRANPIMSAIAQGLDKPQMQALAKYFSERSWPRVVFRAGDDAVAVARSASAAGQCTQCHLGAYLGNSRIPRLAGQHPVYLEQTMRDFKNKVRLNSAAKGSLFAAYSDDEIAALAAYLAAL